MDIPSAGSSPRLNPDHEGGTQANTHRRSSGSREGTASRDQDNNPNSVSRWTASFQRSNYFIADTLEPHSIESTFYGRPRLDRIDSEWQEEQEAENDSIVQEASFRDDDDESFMFRDYGTVSQNDPAIEAARAFAEHTGRQRGFSIRSEQKPLLAEGALHHQTSRRSLAHKDELAILDGSTVYQTVFNSVNILMGVGILSLPLGIAYAGWFLGLIILSGSGLVTWYTALLLAKCMDASPNLFTYADVAFFAFGNKARYYTSLIFSMELMAACTALVVLFGDSLHALIPSVTTTQFKIMGFFIFFTTSFIPLSILSISSVIGILATSAVVVVVIIDGLIKQTAPGSLLSPAVTNFWPAHIGKLPFAIGLMMSPWSAHSVFCNVYRDMRHPYKFKSAITSSYAITYALDMSMGICGYLMFGNFVKDEITESILKTEGYPNAINYFIVIMISIVPLTKMPLNTRPIATTLDVLIGVDNRAISLEGAVGFSAVSRSLIRILVRIIVNLIPVLFGIFVPSFDRVMALLGSGLSYTICILLPVSFYLKICAKDVSTRERIMLYLLFCIASILGLIGTIWSFLPQGFIESLG